MQGRRGHRGVAATVFGLWAAVAAQVFAQESRPDPLAAARIATQAGRGGEAARMYDAVLGAASKDAALLREAAHAAVAARRFADAARRLVRLTELTPDDPSVWFDLGACRFNQCRYDLALPALRRALEADEAAIAPSLRASAHRLAGEAARELGLWGDALGELRLALEHAPDDPDLLRSYGAVLVDAGDGRAALEPLKKAIAARPADLEARRALSFAKEAAGDLDGAAAEAKRVQAARPRDPLSAYRLGALHLARKDLAPAEAFLNSARDFAPRSAETWFALAQVVRLRGRGAEADRLLAEAERLRAAADAAAERSRAFHRARAANAEDAAAHLAYAVDLLSQARYDEAERAFGTILSFAPETEIAIVDLASLLARRGQFEAAELEVRKILERAPSHGPARLVSARVALLRGDARRAAAEARGVLAVDAGSADAHALLAAALGVLGDAEGAAAHGRRAAELGAAGNPR